jgi:hypothetical protein
VIELIKRVIVPINDTFFMASVILDINGGAIFYTTQSSDSTPLKTLFLSFAGIILPFILIISGKDVL